MSVIEIPLQIPRRLASADPLLLAPVAVLLAFSVVMVFSAAIGTHGGIGGCLLYTSPSPRDLSTSRMPSSA